MAAAVATNVTGDRKRARARATADSLGTLKSVIFSSNGVNLFARLFVPAARPYRIVLLFHGFPGSELNFDLVHDLRRGRIPASVAALSRFMGYAGQLLVRERLADWESALVTVASRDSPENMGLRSRSRWLATVSADSLASSLA
jgi:hypothetical protein